MARLDRSTMVAVVAPQQPRSFVVDWRERFARLALCHLSSVVGETLLALSLAGSLFFKVDPAQGREKVLLGLVLTMAPFALVGPLIGPLIDKVRGGHRVVIVMTMALRSAIAVMMLLAVLDDSVLLFPEAFAMLVLAKTYQIAKSSVVPAAVTGDHELVEANSKLQILAGIGSLVAGLVGLVLLQMSVSVVLGATAVAFAGAALAGFRIQPSPQTVSGGGAEGVEQGHVWLDIHRAPTDNAAIAMPRASFAMGMLRFIVGFATFLLAFALRGSLQSVPVERRAAQAVANSVSGILFRIKAVQLPMGPPSWHFGVVVGLSVVGGLVGAAVAPRLRAQLAEDRILTASCGLAVASGVAGLTLAGLLGEALLAFLVAVSAAGAKQAFDAVVQKDSKLGDRGKVFAKYESRFQLFWVVGAIIPTALHIPISVGSLIVIVAAITAVMACVHRGPVPATMARSNVLRRQGRGSLGSQNPRG